MKMNTTNNAILTPEFWAASLWQKALTRWSGRSGQDISYRKHLIHPALEVLLKENFTGGGIRILELGCGDGSLLDDRMLRELVDNGGAYLGIDISNELIEKAKQAYIGGNINFFSGNLTSPELSDSILKYEQFWDCVLSVFTIQEIPDPGIMIDNLTRIIKGDVLTLFITVHPNFGEWLLRSGKMKKENNLIYKNEPGKTPWRWAGYYPIVDEPLEVFYLPYFHRTIGDYRSLFESHGFIIHKIMELPEKTHDLPLLVKRGISPFTPFKTNLYWPRIGEEPSSIAILVRKEGKSERT